MFKSISKALLLASCLAAPFGPQAYALTLEPIATHSANVFDEGAA